MGIDEILSTAVSASTLAWKDYKAQPIDFVAAMSGTTDLASAIFRARHGDRSALKRATLLLASKAQRAGGKKRLHLSSQQSIAFAAAALIELFNTTCRTCCGVSQIVTERLKVTCPVCNGTGIHRFSDHDRAKLCSVNLNLWARWSRRYQMVIDIARSADTAIQDSADRLG